MGSLFSAPSAQRGLMSTDRDRSSSSAPPVTLSTAVRVTREARGSRESLTLRVAKVRASSSASSVDAATSSDSSDGSEIDLWDNASESSSSDASDATPTTLSVVSSLSSTSLSNASTSAITISSASISSDPSSSSSSSLSSDEWSTRSPPRKLPRCRWPFTTRRTRSSRRVSTNDHAEGDEPSENGNLEVPGTSGELIRKLREMEDALTCAICMNRRRQVVFMCGHTACRTCAARIDICHICRRPIERTIPLH